MRLPEPDDQAAGLRRLLGGHRALQVLSILGPDAELNAATGANLAFALSQRGGNICLIDEAPVPANAISRCGLSPSLGLADVLHGGQALDNALTPANNGLRFLRAENGFDLAAEADERAWNQVGEEFARNDWEWLLLAAPTDEHASLALAAPLRLLVLPAVKNRLTEAYALLKAANRRQPDSRWLVLFANADDPHKVDQLMSNLTETAGKFLGIELKLIGTLPKETQFDQAGRTLRPLIELSPAAPTAQAIRQLAERLDGQPAGSGRLDAGTFWQRMGLFSRMNRQPRPHKRHVQHGRAYG